MTGPVTLPHQASCVAIGGRALLVEGPPGSGKSSLALALIDRGAVLLGDDGVLLSVRDGRLHAAPHPSTHGLLEVRNLGLLDMPVLADAPVCLVVSLDRQAPRFIDRAGEAIRAGMVLPHVLLWPDSPVLALRVEQAMTRYGLPAA